VNNYSQSFQDLLWRLTIKEQALMHQLMTVSLFQYVGKSVTYSPYQYVLIDEFQDFHPLALKLLGELYGNSMILSGDFMQSAWYHWVEDLKQLWVQLVDHRTMRDNFRNTLETIQYAHSVFGDQTDSLFLAKRVIKRWPHPEIINNGSARIHIINSLVSLLKPKETIAVIYYEFEYAKQFYTEYSSQTDQHILFPSLDAEHYQELVSWYYSQQLYFISYRESKWLEFDHVVLIDQQTLLDSALAYKKKLWYIGCTRAVKTLSVVR
jgi:DNA helicase IV